VLDTAGRSGTEGASGEESEGGGDGSPRRARPDAVLVVAVVGAALLRIWGLGSQSFWYDEWLTAQSADGSLGNLYRYVTEQAGIPPTFFAMEWVWAQVFGVSEASLRVLPMLAGVATVPIAALAATTWGASRSGTRLVAVLVATNPMLVWYSQEARPYSFVALLTAATLIPLRRWLDGGRRIDLGLWALLGALTVAFHYYAIFVVLLEALSLLLRRRPGRHDLPALAPAAVVSVALLPFALAQVGRRENHSWIGDWELALRLRELRSSALTGPGVSGGPLLAVATVAAIVLLGTMVAGARQPRVRRLLVVAGFGFGAVALAWVTALAGVDGFLSRYFIGAVVTVIVATAAAAHSPVTTRVAAVAVAVLALVGVAAVVTVQRDPHAQRHAWRAVADAFTDRDGDGAAVLVVDRGSTIARPLGWYLPENAVVPAGETAAVSEIDVLTLGDDDAVCNWLVGRPCGYLFVGSPLQPELAESFEEVERVPAGPFVLVRYRSQEPVEVGPDDFEGFSTPDVPLVILEE
jgi:hypothetical protein